MTNRAKAQAFIISYIEKVTEGTENGAIYKKIFATMSDKDFDTFMSDLESGKKMLTVITPNFSKNGISIERNLKIAEELGHKFFQRLWIEGKDETPTYLTPNEYLVVDLPVRRASQLLTKKISVPKHNRVIDSLTGQPTGESKGAKISYPELQVCAAMGLENSMVELMKYRGGDARGHAALNGLISKYGTASQSTLANYASGVESTQTIKTFLLAAHLKSTL
jgi:hypothetical protein